MNVNVGRRRGKRCRGRGKRCRSRGRTAPPVRAPLPGRTRRRAHPPRGKRCRGRRPHPSARTMPRTGRLRARLAPCSIGALTLGPTANTRLSSPASPSRLLDRRTNGAAAIRDHVANRQPLANHQPRRTARTTPWPLVRQRAVRSPDGAAMRRRRGQRSSTGVTRCGAGEGQIPRRSRGPGGAERSAALQAPCRRCGQEPRRRPGPPTRTGGGGDVTPGLSGSRRSPAAAARCPAVQGSGRRSRST